MKDFLDEVRVVGRNEYEGFHETRGGLVFVQSGVSVRGDDILFEELTFYPASGTKMVLSVGDGIKIFHTIMEEARQLGFHTCTVQSYRTSGARRKRSYANRNEEIAMKSLPVPPIPPEIVEKIRQSIEVGHTQEEVFAEMRQLGLFMGYSIKLAHQLYGMSFGEAKMALHYSDTWADCRESNEAMHEMAYQAAKQIGFEEVETSHSPAGRQLQNAP